MYKRLVAGCFTAGLIFAQDAAPPAAAPTSPQGLKERSTAAPGTYQVDTGTRLLLNMINSVSTKQALVGDRLYLETAFPIVADSHIIIPQGSWVTGTITEVKRPGRAKGRGELQVRFDSLTLPKRHHQNIQVGPRLIGCPPGRNVEARRQQNQRSRRQEG